MKKRKRDAFEAIGDPTRRQILMLLTAGALNMQVLAGHFSVSRPAISKHVKVLEEAALVSVEERGRERYCSLNEEGFNEIRDWLAFYDKFWRSRLGRLGVLLKKKAISKRN